MAKQYVDAYVEADVLFRYLWRNYPHLFSLAEQKAVLALIGEGKIAVYCVPG